MRQINYQLRHALPLWLVGLLTGWLPDNRLCLRLRGALVGRCLRRCGKRLQVGRDVTIVGADRLEVGDDVYFAKGTWINASGGVRIDSEVLFGPYVVVASTNHGFEGGSAFRGGVWPAPISVGAGSWVGAHALLTAGSSIGRGVLVAGNAAVSGTFPDNVVIGGIPARVLRQREDNPSPIRLRSDLRDGA